MTDIALLWNADVFAADIALDAGKLVTDDGMRTAIILSLFTDARAHDDDVLPQAGADRRGWWGNAYAEVEGDQIGSRLWLLAREKIIPSVVNRARDYAREAVQWLLTAGIAASIDVQVEAQAGNRLAIAITLTRPSGPARERYDLTWEATA